MVNASDPLRFRVRGMDCAEEVAILKREVGPIVGGEERISFDILNGRMAIASGEPAISSEAVAEAVARTGMRAEIWQEDEDRAKEGRFWQRNNRTILTTTSGLFLLAAFLIQAAIEGSLWKALGLEEVGAEHVVSLPVKVLFGLNAYVSNHFSARHVNWLHACYSLGATLGPLLMTAVLVGVGSWRLGYALVGGILLAMTALFFVTRHRWSEPPKSSEGETRQPVSTRVALREPLVWLQINLFFLYVGLEFTVGQWSFTLLTEARGAGAELAGLLAGGFYGAIGVGRILSGAVTHRIGLDWLIRFSMLAVLVGSLLFAFSPRGVDHLGLAIIGLGLAPIFPCLMARTPQRLGAEYATHAVGFQVSAGMLGAALVPSVAGLLVERMGLEFVAQFAVLLATLLLTTHELLLYVASHRLLRRH